MKLIAYYRVSTQRQATSGLGLEAQEAAVASYASTTGCKVIDSFTDIESGTNNERPELLKAIARCKLTNARLVIARLDRLSRSVRFVSTLQESNIKFIACDMPEANETMIQLFAVLAQAERKAISERTKAALEAAKARGVKLGNPNLKAAREARQGDLTASANKTRSDKALSFALDLEPVITEIKTRLDNPTLRAIALELNNMGITTARNAEFTATSVKRVLDILKL